MQTDDKKLQQANKKNSMKCIYNNMEQLCVTKCNHLEIQTVKDLDI